MAEHIHFVTGKLAERTLRTTLTQLAEQTPFRWSLQVLPISVAALMSPEWIAQRIDPPKLADRVMIPGYCHGDLSCISAKTSATVERGPQDLRRLPEYFGRAVENDSYGDYDIEIIAEINHASKLPPDELVREARALVADGADVIDVGCEPHTDRAAWDGVGDAVRTLRDAGMRVSIDSFHPGEVAAACRAGAELVLSVNAANREAARDWGAQVVVIPDDPHALGGLDATVSFLDKQGVPLRIDPVIEPIGFGFARSLGRYLQVRDRFPDTAMMMGVGNLSEMTGVDSAGVNAMLIGFCQELGIQSVLTTQVINWGRTAVREIDCARRLMYHAASRHTVPRHVDKNLVMLRDTKLRESDPSIYEALASKLTDRNVCLFADTARGELHAMNNHVHVRGDDPFVMFDKLDIDDPSHAFYLGYELAKAVTALTLGKNYTQDQALDWGMLTRDEVSHHERRK